MMDYHVVQRSSKGFLAGAKIFNEIPSPKASSVLAFFDCRDMHFFIPVSFGQIGWNKAIIILQNEAISLH
jgi:hypothetical protein